MGYEDDMLQRKKRRRRKRRQRFLGLFWLLVILLLIAAGVVLFAGEGLPMMRENDFFNGLMESVQDNEILTGIADKFAELTGREPETEALTEAVTETEAPTEPPIPTVSQEVLDQAAQEAAMYDYDQAVAILRNDPAYSYDTNMQALAAEYEAAKASCVPIDPENVTHIFYHTLVVDPARAFDPDKEGYDGWQQWMTTVTEFDRITQSMYERGYVLVSIHDLITKTTNEDGSVTIVPNQIMLPEGKKAYVMSLDDLSYYHTYEDHGVASKIVLDEAGKPTCEYVQADGTTVYGDYDVVPRLDTFIEEHPDACYHGARGIIALTGYNGILGYRTDGTYDDAHNTNTDVYYADDLQIKWLNEHPDYNWEEECAQAKQVVEAMKSEGWEFASHTWGHKAVGDASYDELVRDTERWFEYVSPLIGESDAIIFAHGQDIMGDTGYTDANDKYMYLKSKGFDIYCPVDSRAYTLTITEDYLHQGRRNLDGYRIYQDAVSEEPRAADLFDASYVLDPDRPLPVPELN